MDSEVIHDVLEIFEELRKRYSNEDILGDFHKILFNRNSYACLELFKKFVLNYAINDILELLKNCLEGYKKGFFEFF